MAISPTVNQFMQQDQGQEPQDAAQLFRSQFSDLAFNSLRAKFPALINNVVIMKTLAADVNEGTAFGAGLTHVKKALYIGNVTLRDNPGAFSADA